MPRMVGFIGGTYALRSVNVDCQRTINLYPELNEIGLGKEREVAALIGTAGLRLQLNLGDAPIRCLFTASNGLLYVVCGNKLVRVSKENTSVQIGSLLTNNGVVNMCDNGTMLAVVDGSNLYVHDLSGNTTSRITSEGWRGSYHIAFVDGYFVFVKPNSGQFYISGLYSSNLDPLDFATSEGRPDNIVDMLVDHRELWMFGDQSTEIFYNTGNSDFPFERIQGAFIEIGCAAKQSACKLNNTVFWLAKSENGHGYVVAAQGYQPQRISNHAVELAIQSYDNISDAVAYTYQQGGHVFYVLNFPSAETTWVYDVVTGMWHERAYLNNGKLERHRADNHAFAYGRNYCGDYENGNLYVFDLDYYTDNGQEIPRIRTAPHQTQDLNRIFYTEVQIDMENGTGLDGTQQGSNPQIMLQWSDDGGHTWSNEKWIESGKIGAYRHRARWFRLGWAWDRVYRVKITDPVKVVLIGATYEAQAGGR